MMKLLLKTRRSAGVRVTAGVHRVLVRANAARDRRDWAEAAAAYREALKSDPALAHIWVQLGNMLRELGMRPDAADAYARAAVLRPGLADAHVQLGHMAADANDPARAARHFLDAFRADPGHLDGAMGLYRALGRARGATRQRLIEAVRSAMGPDAPEDAAPAPPAGAGTTLVFDVSDLIGFFVHARLPTGIQRVQIQTIAAALQRHDRDVRVCCFIEGRDDWLEIPAPGFLRLIELSLLSGDCGDRAWITTLHRLHLRLALAPPFAFPQGAFLINLGSSWQLHNYFLFVRAAKARYGIRYVPFIHDLIPIVAPEHFTKAARMEVVPWVIGVLAHADHFLVNSESTRRDLVRTAALLGPAMDPAAATVVRLDADFRTNTPPTADAALARWRLDQEAFVLLVSTVESRKGHATAFDAWSLLIAQHGAAAVPKLVCVGRRGWLSDGVYDRLDRDPVLAGRVTMLEGLSDSDLTLLYQACAFTIYPSLYEGWGLPITEALCHGKPVIAARTSSLPEAGGDLAVYVEPGDAPDLAAAVGRMAFDAPYRSALAARIEAGFRPRSWADIARQIEAEMDGIGTRVPIARALPTPLARLGDYHSVARGTATRLWPGAGVGEAFRTGIGWHAPTLDAAWTREQGGDLAIGLPPPRQPLRVGLLLIGDATRDLDWQVDVQHGPTLEGVLRRGRQLWATFDYGVPHDGNVLRLRLSSEPTAAAPGQDDTSPIGLAGFFLHPTNDAPARLRLLEAIALRNLAPIDAYRDAAPSAVHGVEE